MRGKAVQSYIWVTLLFGDTLPTMVKIFEWAKTNGC